MVNETLTGAGDDETSSPRQLFRQIEDWAATPPPLPRGLPLNGEPGRLLDAAGIVREYGVTRASAEALMRRVPKVAVPGIRKVWVHRDAIDRLLAESEVRP